MRIKHILIALSLFLVSSIAFAEGQNLPQAMGKIDILTEQDGATLYKAHCQVCHMPAGEGAKGAGMFPPLAKQPHLEDAEYVAMIIMQGLNGMPSLAGDMTDEQVATVSNFVASNFGNNGKNMITAKQVKPLRPAKPINYE